jgi:lipoyl-dependent peroxiredoxin
LYAATYKAVPERSRLTDYVYTAVGKGGRDGRVRSASGSYDLRTRLADSHQEGVTPEELIAGAWASCFGTTLTFVAREHGVELGEAVVQTKLTYLVDHETPRYEIVRAELTAVMPEDAADVDAILEKTHERCPISKLLVRGVAEIDVGAVAELVAEPAAP